MRIIVIALVVLLVYWSLMSKSGYKVVSYPPEQMEDRFRWAGDAATVIQHPWAPN